MTVYVDDAGVLKDGRKWYHLAADTVEELHAFAERIGLKPEWFQEKNYPHYDVTKYKRNQALREGARYVSTRVLLRVLQKKYGRKEGIE